MQELTLIFDKKAAETISLLMKYYNVKNKAELISKAIHTLKIVAHITETKGELIARKDNKETILMIT